MELRRARLLVSGHVQGVFFRASMRDVARAVGCSGWVANRPDGRVEAEVQGTPGAVDRVVEFARVGPGQANVTDVDVTDVEPLPDESGFVVR
jgi:acylphosphatase